MTTAPLATAANDSPAVQSQSTCRFGLRSCGSPRICIARACIPASRRGKNRATAVQLCLDAFAVRKGGDASPARSVRRQRARLADLRTARAGRPRPNLRAMRPNQASSNRASITETPEARAPDAPGGPPNKEARRREKHPADVAEQSDSRPRPRGTPSPRPSAAGGASGARPAAKRNPQIAYLSFAVANSYDAPMLAAAGSVAKAQGASVTVFDAANDPKKQLAQLQTVITSKQYDGIIVQPIFGPQLIPTINDAIKAGHQGRQHRPDPRHEPRHRRVAVARALRATSSSSRPRSARKQGQLVVQACAALNANPCKVGYLYSVKVSSLDTAIRKGFDQVTAGKGSTSSPRARRSTTRPTR